MKIIADTATLYTPEQGAALGLDMVSVGVAIDGQSYADYTDITTAQFLEKIRAGGVPSSSQPALGDLLELFESSPEEMLVLTVGDGLSGGYQTALGAKAALAENSSRIHVLNSGSLAGPLRYMARRAAQLRDAGQTVEQILEKLEKAIRSSVSFVIPEDFEFLRRSGRLTAITAKIGGALRLLPVLTQTEDRTRITPAAIKRSWAGALDTIFQRLAALGIDRDWLITVSHGCDPEKAENFLRQLSARFPESETELLELSPALLTHGGPGCLVVQAVRKV